MATRAIVTSHPVVACDVCGRRLLRGETPDVFLAGGQRRTVCELCVPRATAGGWLREADEREPSTRPARQRRAGSLLGRLRQRRQDEEPLRRQPASARRREPVEDAALYEDEDPLYDYLEGGSTEGAPGAGALYIGSVKAGHAAPAQGHDEVEAQAAQEVAAMEGLELSLARALELFNAAETAQRVAGVSRSLGSPSVVVRAHDSSGRRVIVLVAWELCWYRYELDLDEQTPAPRLVAEGMELAELEPEDRVANAVADERGRIALASAGREERRP